MHLFHHYRRHLPRHRRVVRQKAPTPPAAQADPHAPLIVLWLGAGRYVLQVDGYWRKWDAALVGNSAQQAYFASKNAIPVRYGLIDAEAQIQAVCARLRLPVCHVYSGLTAIECTALAQLAQRSGRRIRPRAHDRHGEGRSPDNVGHQSRACDRGRPADPRSGNRS